MRVLIVSQYFTPEVTAASLRIHPLAAGLAQRGHDIEVVCEVPNHPSGVKQPGYGAAFAETRELDGFRATYVWVRASESKGARHRLASYATFALAATMASCVRARRPDVVLATSPPLSVGAIGAIVAARHRVPWLFDVRDLWPEVAVALGELPEGRALRAAERLERWLYDSAGAVTTPTQPFAEHIRARTRDAGKVELLANGTTEAWLRAGDAEPGREAAGLPDERFVWTYAGNVGLSQDLETALEAARLLGDGFRLQIVGEGASRQALEARAAAFPPGAVGFSGLVAPDQAARIMRASDALLVSLADRPELGKSIPIKLYDCCAIGRPVIVAAPGEPRRIAQREDIALVAAPGDAEGLATAVRALRDDATLSARLAGAARGFAALHLREHQVHRLEEILRRMTYGPGVG